MGEYVWCTMDIGGKLTEATAWAIQNDFSTGYFFDGDSESAVECMKAGGSVNLRGERNYGNADELEVFCQERGLSYNFYWSGASGSFNPGLHYWRPGMEGAKDWETNDDGDIVLTHGALARAAQDGRTLADLVNEYALPALPPLELDPDAATFLDGALAVTEGGTWEPREPAPTPRTSEGRCPTCDGLWGGGGICPTCFATIEAEQALELSGLQP